jgi:prepilin-type processing-associated H-X9-DG protein
MVGVTIVVLLLSFLGSDTRAKEQCRENLKRIALALHDYESRNGSLPPACQKGKDGRPMVSWRVLILPFLARQDLYDAYHFDESWDSPSNSQLIAQMPEVFRCPAAPRDPPGRTSYVAVVGSQTMWPGDRGVTLEEMSAADGVANTVCLIEIDKSDIAWTEPRDLLFRDLIPPAEDVIGQRFSSPHKDAVTVVFADGSVRRLRKQAHTHADRNALSSILTAWGGQPYRGEWLPGEEPAPDESFPAEIDADKMRATDVTPYLQTPLASGRNAIYCSTFQIAWDDLRDQFGQLQVEGSPAIATGLNNGSFSRKALAPESYVALAGLVRDGIRDKIKEQMGRKFPNVSPSVRASSDLDIVAYAFLQKNLPFKARFNVLSQPLDFHSQAGDVPVKSFGFKEFDSADFSREQLGKQVRVLHYGSDEEFVIELKPVKDEIVLARVRPSVRLDETLRDVQALIRDKSKQVSQPTMQDKDELRIPRLTFNIAREYHELIDKHIANIANGGAWFKEARQSVRMLLNESGARIESEVVIGPVSNGHSTPPPPPVPRHFVFDKPFLLYIKQSDADQPYLVVWVSNPEIMYPIR